MNEGDGRTLRIAVWTGGDIRQGTSAPIIPGAGDTLGHGLPCSHMQRRAARASAPYRKRSGAGAGPVWRADQFLLSAPAAGAIS